MDLTKDISLSLSLSHRLHYLSRRVFSSIDEEKNDICCANPADVSELISRRAVCQLASFILNVLS